MGCDIHLYVEVKQPDGTWASADKWIDGEDNYRRAESPFYDNRNYNLYAILANVKNGIGFAGCKTGKGFVPIINPKGLPDDVSSEIKDQSDYWNGDGHSHSHLTVSEIFSFDWTQVSCLQGWVNASEFDSYMRRKEWGYTPESYCGMISGASVRHISNDQMSELIKSGQNTDGAYTLLEWTKPYHDCATDFWSNTIPRLLHLGEPDNVRIVFWFDN